MNCSGGCYCGNLRFQVTAEPVMKAQCHCRECQYITGGGPNIFMMVPAASFSFTKGAPKQFKRADLDGAVTREFCADCGTHISTRLARPVVVVKAGTLDDPSIYGMPQMAIQTADKQAFHQIPDGLKTFERFPQR